MDAIEEPDGHKPRGCQAMSARRKKENDEVLSEMSQVIDAFCRQEYNSCVQLVSKNLNRTTFCNLQILLISLQRMGLAGVAEDWGRDFLEKTKEHSWDNALLRLTLGMSSISEVLRMSRGDRKKECEANYYEGCRLLTLGQVDAARARFETCLAGGEKCLEHFLAWVQRDCPPPQIDHSHTRVIDLNMRP
jgi:hypothetical protein